VLCVQVGGWAESVSVQRGDSGRHQATGEVYAGFPTQQQQLAD